MKECGKSRYQNDSFPIILASDNEDHYGAKGPLTLHYYLYAVMH